MSTVKWESRNREIDTSKDLIFQTLDWYCEDVTDDSGFNQYKIFVFGIDTLGIPISLQINNFYPFFFVEIHPNWDSTSIYSIKESSYAC
jgi:hypothetical protein